MPRQQPTLKRLSTAARWPVGVGLTAWRYMWRTTPVHRRELLGSMEEDAPPDLPPDVSVEGLQLPEDGAGPLVHRLYRAQIRGSAMSPEELIEAMKADLDEVAPSEFASFQKVEGAEGRLAVGDEYVVRMPGPWDGPVRVVASTPASFRLATLDGHLEAGQIEFRASAAHQTLDFVIESWARSGDRFSDLLYTHLRMSKEVQLHMWTSVLERVAELSGGRTSGGIAITTRRADDLESGGGGLGPGHRRARRRLAELADRELNFDPDRERPPSERDGWHLDDLREPLPHEPAGDPVDDGSWQVARELMSAYQVADPSIVRATYRHDAPLAGRDMVLQIRFAGLRFYVGVRVGEVYEETREVAGRPARVFGWDYRTLEGHFEEGQMHYEVWKWLDTGDVEFRVHAFSRTARSGPALLRLGFRLVGRREQLEFYRQVCLRMRRLTLAELETRRTAAYRAAVARG
ncbi:MAG: DUF1990 domain-containing protein [Actinomycetota bacterium]|nr:DUF1990 domain-containing protein [Actinomycetota bacterium]